MNSVYVVDPVLTNGKSAAGQEFLASFEGVICDYANCSVLRSIPALQKTSTDDSDVVVFLNRPDEGYGTAFLSFLQKALRAKTKILPVATGKEERRPPTLVQDRQSFDIVENLRQRALGPAQVRTIATVFARQVLSELNPTLTGEPMHIFLSHRRLDGEEVTAGFHKVLLGTAQTAFRDLFDVRVGEDAQEIIDARLRESDAVIFLDTPRTGESEWIAKELRLALELQIPIVWVRLGGEENRTPLKVAPSGEPHFRLTTIDPASEDFDTPTAENIIHKAFEIHHRDYVDRLFDEVSRLEQLADEHGFQLRRLEARRMVYSLTLPRTPSRYNQRPLTHLLQLFGRVPTPMDIGQFANCARDFGYERHPNFGYPFDSAILLAATPSRPRPIVDDSGIHSDSIGDYVAEIERAVGPPKSGRKRLAISGAFADCEPEFHQKMTSAVYAMVNASLRESRGVIFGAHPTFQFLIFDLARRLRPDDFLNSVRMYVSKFFVTDAAIEELRQNAEIVAIDAVESNREKSLTAMRQAMLNDTDAGGVVVIGGKTRSGGHVPGIDEEIEIARRAGLPVFILGSVGGRSSEIISSMSASEMVNLNGLSKELNESLASSLDYGRLARIIIQALS
jgi:hypothetical protein